MDVLKDSDLEKFRIAAEFAPAHIVFTDLDGVILYANPAAEKITGYSVSEMIGQRPSLWGGHMLKEYYQILWRTIKDDKEVFHSEIKNRRKTGELYEAEVWISPVLRKGNKLVGFVGVEIDISDKKKLVEELRERVETLREVTENIEEVFFLIDVNDKKLLYMSPAYETIFGRPTSHFQNLSTEEWVNEVIAKEYRGQVLSLITGGLLQTKGIIECQIVRPDNSIRWTETRVFPVFDSAGKIYRIAGIVADVTDSKQAEVRIKELDELKNKFIEVASHQFRTPLTAIRWNLEMVINEDASPLNNAQMGFAKVTYLMSVEIINRLNDLLVALDIGTNKIALRTQLLSIASLAKGVIEDKVKACRQKGVICEFVANSDDSPILGDPGKIRMVMNKLIQNGIDYTVAGKIVVKVKQRDNLIRFEVSDTGVGIPKAEQKDIFSRFYRGSNAILIKPDGTGLGLYISKYIVEQHGGKIGFESEEGNGSLFWFEIPTTS